MRLVRIENGYFSRIKKPVYCEGIEMPVVMVEQTKNGEIAVTIN